MNPEFSVCAGGVGDAITAVEAKLAGTGVDIACPTEGDPGESGSIDSDEAIGAGGICSTGDEGRSWGVSCAI